MNRYSRQVLFSPIGESGQKKIGASSVVLIGCGALGTVCAEMLARAGVGRLRLVDRDFVEKNNLQRQSLFDEEHARNTLPKAIAAKEALEKINTDIQLEAIIQDVTWENIEDLCKENQVIVDGTDNFETRFLINDVAFKNNIPWIYGACVGSYGVALTFQPALTLCFQCLFDRSPEAGKMATCDTTGIVSPVVHGVAAYQVAQTLKILVGEKLESRLLQLDAWKNSWRTIGVSQARNPNCSCCAELKFRYLKGREKSHLTQLCGRNAVQVSPRRKTDINFRVLSQRLGKSTKVKFNDYIMRIQINGLEITLFSDGRSIIKGTEDFTEARAVYAKYIGI